MHSIWVILLIVSPIYASDIPPDFSTDCSTVDSCLSSEKTKTCRCDAECHKYGDCCGDASSAHLSSLDAVEYICDEERTIIPVYTKVTCPTAYSGRESHAVLCLEADKADVLGSAPVTSRATGTTYTNRHCALCNEELEKDLTPWSVQITYPSHNKEMKLKRSYVEKHLAFDAEVGEWGLRVTDGFIVCPLAYIQPKQFDGIVRSCTPGVVQNCSSQHRNMQDKCLSYHAERIHRSSGVVFKNVHCAECNDIPVEELNCSVASGQTSLTSGWMTMVFPGGKWLDHAKYICSLGNMWDPFTKRCRKDGALSIPLQQSSLGRPASCFDFWVQIVACLVSSMAVFFLTAKE